MPPSDLRSSAPLYPHLTPADDNHDEDPEIRIVTDTNSSGRHCVGRVGPLSRSQHLPIMPPPKPSLLLLPTLSSLLPDKHNRQQLNTDAERLKQAIHSAGKKPVLEAVHRFVAELRAGGPALAEAEAEAAAGGAGADGGKPKLSSAAEVEREKAAKAAKEKAEKEKSKGGGKSISITAKFHCRPQDIFECFTVSGGACARWGSQEAGVTGGHGAVRAPRTIAGLQRSCTALATGAAPLLKHTQRNRRTDVATTITVTTPHCLCPGMRLRFPSHAGSGPCVRLHAEPRGGAAGPRRLLLLVRRQHQRLLHGAGGARPHRHDLALQHLARGLRLQGAGVGGGRAGGCAGVEGRRGRRVGTHCGGVVDMPSGEGSRCAGTGCMCPGDVSLRREEGGRGRLPHKPR